MASRSAVPVTIGDLFDAERSNGLAGRKLADGDKARLSAALRTRPGVGIGDVEGELGSAYAGALGTRLIDVFVAAWSRLSEVARFAEAPHNKPGDRHLLPLARHTITSRHEPKVEVLVDQVAALQIPLEVRFTADFEAAVLVIEAGQVHAIRAGGFVASGAVTCRGVTLSSVKSRPFEMPAEVILTPPFRIPETGMDGRSMRSSAPLPEPTRVTPVIGAGGRTVILSGTDDGGQPLRFVLREPASGQMMWTLGRRPERADLLVRDKSVSGEHARLRGTAGRGIEMCDLGSSNGTFVDGRRIGPEFVPIDTAGRIVVGGIELRVGRA